VSASGLIVIVKLSYLLCASRGPSSIRAPAKNPLVAHASSFTHRTVASPEAPGERGSGWGVAEASMYAPTRAV
jgi:hypothetical protein